MCDYFKTSKVAGEILFAISIFGETESLIDSFMNECFFIWSSCFECMLISVYNTKVENGQDNELNI